MHVTHPVFCKGFIDGDKKSKLNVGPTNLPKTKAVIDEEKMRYIITFHILFHIFHILDMLGWHHSKALGTEI